MEAFVIFFSALWDKEGFDLKRLRRVLDEMNEYADNIRDGYVTIQDLHAAAQILTFALIAILIRRFQTGS